MTTKKPPPLDAATLRFVRGVIARELRAWRGIRDVTTNKGARDNAVQAEYVLEEVRRRIAWAAEKRR